MTNETSLTETERACLQRLLQHPDEGQICSQDTLDSLLHRGLVEKRPSLSLPVNPQRAGYHLTAVGRRALAGT